MYRFSKIDQPKRKKKCITIICNLVLLCCYCLPIDSIVFHKVNIVCVWLYLATHSFYFSFFVDRRDLQGTLCSEHLQQV